MHPPLTSPSSARPSGRVPAASRLARATIGLATVVTTMLLTGPIPMAVAADEFAPTSWQVQPSGAEGPGDRPYFVYDVDPGAEIEDNVSITNLSEQDIEVAVFGTDALNTETGDFDLLATAEDPQDVGAWLKLDSDRPDGRSGTVTVPARDRVEIPFRIDVPENATPGDHVGGVVTSLTTERVDDGETVLVDARVAARIYLNVRGELVPRLEVTDIERSYAGSLWNPFGGELEVSYTVRNVGNIRLAGTQTISARGVAGWGDAQLRLDLPEVLPGNEIRQTMTLRGVPAAVKLDVGAEVQPVDTVGRIADPIEPVRASSSVWVLPWLLVAGAALLAAAAWLALHTRRKHRKTVEDLRQEVASARQTAVAEESATGISTQA